MPYSANEYQKAVSILNNRREDANLNTRLKTEEITEKIPEISNIQRELQSVGFSVSKILLFSGDKEKEVERLKNLSLKLQQKRKKLLKDNGYDENALETKFTCPYCNDTGFIDDRLCSCHKEILKEIQRNKIRRFAPLDKCTFENFDINYYPNLSMENGVSPQEKAKKICDSCNRYAHNFAQGSPGLILMGKTGLGKTHLSLAIANVAISRGLSVLYGTAQNILSDLSNENFGRDTRCYVEKDILQTDLLIFDDLGTEFLSPYSVSSLYNIFNTRILTGKPTIISTNYSWQELEEKYDQRITSRLAGEFSTLVLEGNDIRYIK